MKKNLWLVPVLALSWGGMTGCGDDPEPAMRESTIQPVDPLKKIRPRSPSDIPPGLKKLFAQYAKGFFTETQGNRDVFASELQSRLRAGEPLYIVDVRDVSAYQKGHLPSALHIPIEELFAEEVLETFPSDGTPIVVICASGHVASQAVGALGALGYNAYALRFGMIGWYRTTPVQVHSSTQVPQVINGLGGSVEQ